MVQELKADPAALLAAATKIDSIREQMSPAHLPAGFTPAGAETASAAAATKLSAAAAAAANAMWRSWHELGETAARLRAAAGNYANQDEASARMLSGGAVTGSVATAPAPEGGPPMVTPQTYTGSVPSGPEELASLLRAGAGADAAEDFGAQWVKHGLAVSAAAESATAVAAGLGASWSGVVHTSATERLSQTATSLGSHSGIALAVGHGAIAHGTSYRTATGPGGVPTPGQFEVWRRNVENATAANRASGGLYSGVVADTQAQLGEGMNQASGAYEPYVLDATTGQLIDPLTGEVIDPLTSPDNLMDDADEGDEIMSTGQELLTGLLGGAMSGLSSGLGAIQQGVQQMGQMAGQAAGQVAKAVSQSSPSDPPETEIPELGSPGDFGGAGGPSGMTPASAGPPPAAPAPPAAAPPSPAMRGPAGPGATPAGGGMPMAPMMPGAGGGSGDKGKAGTDKNRLGAKRVPNSQKVIGESDAARLTAKRAQRQEQMRSARKASAAGSDPREDE